MPESPTDTRHENRLKELREAAGETKPELAVALGLKGDMQIERWESGRNDIPISRARTLGERYGVSLSFLLCDETVDEAA